MKRSLQSGIMLVLLGISLFGAQAAAASYSGKVFCPNNNPLPEANVYLYLVNMETQDKTMTTRLAGKTATDKKGEFKIVAEIPDDSGNEAVFCVAEKKDYSYTWAMGMGNQDAEYELHMCYSQSISGAILDSQKNPVPGARIRAIILTFPVKNAQNQMPNYLMNLEPMPFFTAESDAQGKFEIKDLPDSASVEFLITKPGMGTLMTAPSDINPASGLQYAVGQKDLVLTMDKGLTVSGTAQNAGGKSIPDAVVSIGLEDIPVNLLAKPVKTDSSGAYRFTDLAAGKYRITMQSASGDNASETIDLQQDMKVTLKAKKGSLVRVKVLDESEKPVENVNVTLYQSGQVPVNGKTGADGLFEKKVPAGTYSVQVYKPGMRRTKQSEITVEDEKDCETTISLAGSAKITGLVTNAKGKPVADAEIKILPNYGEMLAPIKSDEKGHYTISWSPEDISWTQSFLLVAVARETKEGITVDIDNETKEMNLQLKPTLSIAGKIVNEKGQPIAQAALATQIGTSNWSSSLDNKSVQTDPEGRYTIDCLPVDAQYYFNVIGPAGYGTGSIRPDDPMDGSIAQIQAKDTVLKVADKSVSGKVMDVDGKPVEGAQIHCYGDGQPNLNTKSDKDGKFTLSPICDGVVELNINFNKNNQWMYTNANAMAGDTEVEIILAPERSGRPAVRRPPSQIDKTLSPVLSDPNQLDGKPLLVCVWDYQQRPSRYVVRELAGKTALLDQFQVTTVLLQGQTMDKTIVDGWLKDNNINFISDMITDEADKKRFEMGVQGLPWLILTDKNHKVLAEGFDIQTINTVLAKLK